MKLLLLKTHVRSYTKKDGTFVAEHDDKRNHAAQAAQHAESANFKKWFAGSKVVDDAGRPLVVYRGTYRDWVDRSEITGPLSFTEHEQIASVYASRQDSWGGANYTGGSVVYPCYLAIKKPLKISTVGVNFGKLMKKLRDNGEVSISDALQVMSEVVDRYVKNRGPGFQMKLKGFDNYRWFVNWITDEVKQGKLAEAWDTMEAWHVDAFALVDNPTFCKLLESHGYDGVIHKDVFQGGARHVSRLTGREIDEGALSARKEHWTYRPFHPQQIKSVTGNSGAFDPESADMTKARPTEAQALAGNYKKRRVQWAGLEIAIENPVGTIREGKGWRTKMQNAYGYICRSEGTDGDEVDVYLGPDMDGADTVYVVHQRKAGDWDKFDEDKCMLGFPSEAAARAAYLAHYDDKRFLGDITAMPVADFVAKVRATKDRPAMIKGDFGRPLMMIRLPA